MATKQAVKENEIGSIRHSFAHVLASAVKKLYPAAELGIGPVIESGFYYDFGNIEISEKDLQGLMKEIEE